MASRAKSPDASSSDSSNPSSGVWGLVVPQSEPKGYPLDILLDKSNTDHIVCGRCHYILRHPVQTSCGHRFCNECISYALSQSSTNYLECPSCRSEEADEVNSITRDQIFPDTGIRKELRNLTVKCSVEHCKWSGKLAEFEEHYQNLHNEVKCPYGCKIKLTRLTADQHMKENMTEHLNLTNSRLSALESNLRSVRANTSEANNIDVERINKLEQEIGNLQQELKKLSSSKSQVKRSSTNVLGKELAKNELSAKELEFVDEQLKIIDTTLTVLTRDTEKMGTLTEELEESKKLKRKKYQELVTKMTAAERVQVKIQDSVNDLARRIGVLEGLSCDGELLWKIERVTQRLREATSGAHTSAFITSPTFCNTQAGYRLCGKMYLNGDGAGRGTHVSLYLVILRGPYDAMLKWPFNHKVKITVVNQTNRSLDRQDVFTADPNSTSFQRPTADMNPATGFPKFISHADLLSERNGFVKDDTMFVRIIIEK